ncbi:MAG: desulfoferrodoxin [Firmicutes bacterium]|nr:desulfoferrodoxin [Bacillota bacterium]
MEMKFYRCSVCGQMVAIVKKKGCPIMCCGKPMEEIIPGTTDAAVEKHVPVYEVKDNIVSVTVGSVEHPMIPEHYIEWISLQTKFGNQRRALQPGEAPKADFALLPGDEVLAVYAYCNLHSLWKG